MTSFWYGERVKQSSWMPGYRCPKCDDKGLEIYKTSLRGHICTECGDAYYGKCLVRSTCTIKRWLIFCWPTPATIEYKDYPDG